MSLASTGVTFVLGTLEIGKAIFGLSQAADAVEKGYMAKLPGAVVTGIDLYFNGLRLVNLVHNPHFSLRINKRG